MRLYIKKIRTDISNNLYLSGIFDEDIEKAAAKFSRQNVITVCSGPLPLDNQVTGTMVKNIKIEGKWLLSEKNELLFRVSGAKNPYLNNKRLSFKGVFMSPSANSLGYEIYDYKSALSRSKRIALKGVWQADRYNRIVFKAAKKNSKYDSLVFQGVWKVFNNEITFTTERTDKKTKSIVANTMVFKGNWSFYKNKVSYILHYSGRSKFDFKVQYAPRTISADSGRLRFYTDIKYRYKKRLRNVRSAVDLTCKWELKPDFKCAMILSYSNDHSQKIVFKVSHIKRKKGSLAISISADTREEMGLDVLFESLPDKIFSLYISASKNRKETKIIGGMKYRF